MNSADRRNIVSLAAVHSSDTVVVRRILSHKLSGLCTDLGFGEGDRITCMTESHDYLLLRTPAGRKVAFERDQARFIEVSRN